MIRLQFKFHNPEVTQVLDPPPLLLRNLLVKSVNFVQNQRQLYNLRLSHFPTNLQGTVHLCFEL